jgi:hypothetical protein
MGIAALVLLSMCFQDLALVSFGSFALKPFHIIVTMVFVYTLSARKMEWEIPFPLFFVGVVAMLAISMAGYTRFGFSSMFLNYIFMCLACLTIYNVGHGFSDEQWRRLIQTVASAVMVAVYIKLILNIAALRRFFDDSWGGHPVLPTFLGGGVNLEASWLAMFSVYFKDNRSGALYLAMATVLSMLYASRAGIIICVLAFFYVFVLRGGRRGISLRFFLAAMVIFLVFVALAHNGNVLAERLLSAGEDRGSQGRLNMWQYALPTFLDSPILGNGAGNATRHMSLVANTNTITEDNVHMYFLQVLLDFGLAGFLIFIAMVVYFLKRCISDRLKSPFESYILIYLMASFIQFRGGDVLVGFALAGLFSYWEMTGADGRKKTGRGSTRSDAM